MSGIYEMRIERGREGLRVKLCGANEVRGNLRERLIINNTTQSLQLSVGVEI